MRQASRALLFAAVLSLTGMSGLGTASDSVRVPGTPPTAGTAPAPTTTPSAPRTRPAGATRPRPAAASPAAYWGPAAPAPPRRKPTAVRRLFNRIGTFLGADEEMGTTPTYRDPATGRTNTGGSKPFMKPMEQ